MIEIMAANEGLHHARCQTLFALTVLNMAGRTVVTRHNYDPAIGYGAGRPVSTEDARRLLQSIADPDAEPQDGVLPANTIVADRDCTAWIVPGKRRPMWFRLQAANPFRRDPVWPNLLMVAAGGRLFVAATKQGRYTGPDQPLFHAPLMNVYSRGGVCLPRDVSIGCGVQAMTASEAVIFETAFSHPNHEHPVRWSKRGSLTNAMLRLVNEAAKPAARRWPAASLRPMDITVAGFIEGIRRGR